MLMTLSWFMYFDHWNNTNHLNFNLIILMSLIKGLSRSFEIEIAIVNNFRLSLIFNFNHHNICFLIILNFELPLSLLLMSCLVGIRGL